jgi:integrase
MDTFESIRVTKVSEHRYCITLMFEGTKHRYYNGLSIGSTSKPNSLPPKLRLGAFESLLNEFRLATARGWTPNEPVTHNKTQVLSSNDLIDQAIAHKLSKPYSVHYQRKIKWIGEQLKSYLNGKALNPKSAAAFLNQPHWSPAMRNNLRSHYSSLESSLMLFGYRGTAKSEVKRERVAERMHKPFDNTAAILSEIKEFDQRLYLCCLIAYGCLLRPHREIRLLRWSEISIQKQQIALAGDRTKGKRNRVLPIPNYVLEELIRLKSSVYQNDEYVFGQNNKPYGPDFFNGLWTKFKRRSKLLKPDQTIYSFRHTGAIRVFEKTGSLQTLQAVMGHSDLKVSLTYLRGLEVKQVTAQELPEL